MAGLSKKPATRRKVAKTPRNSNLQVDSRFKLTHF